MSEVLMSIAPLHPAVAGTAVSCSSRRPAIDQHGTRAARADDAIGGNSTCMAYSLNQTSQE